MPGHLRPSAGQALVLYYSQDDNQNERINLNYSYVACAFSTVLRDEAGLGQLPINPTWAYLEV